MRIDIIDTHQALLDLKDNWVAVYESDPEGQFFLSWTWISNWLEGDRSQWFILAAAPERSSEYVAFFPLRLRTKMRADGGGFYNEIGLAGRGLSDYTGLLARPENEAEAISAFGLYLRSRNWTALNLEFFRASPQRLERLLKYLPEKNFRWTLVETINKRDNINNSICPYVTLPDSWDAYLATLGSNTRRNMRRYLRKVEESDEFRITEANAETIDRDLDNLLETWRAKWSSRKGQRTDGLVATNRKMFKACFAAGVLYLPVLWQGDKLLAALINFIDHERRALHCFMTARDEAFQGMPSPAIVLHAHSIHHAIENGFRIYDFTRGNEDYKYIFGTREALLHNIRISTPNRQNVGGKLDPQCLSKVLSKTVALHKSNKIAEAEQGYRQVLAAAPKSSAALYGLGQLLMKKGEHGAAAKIFRKLVLVKPDERRAWLRLGAALESANRFAEAAKVYQQLIEKKPSDAEAYGKLGYVLLALGKTGDAGSALQTALNLQHGQESFIH